MRISTKSRYGLKAMIELAKAYVEEATAVLPLSVIAKNTDLSESYLEQLFMPMRKAGLVLSTRGSLGGYQLSSPPQAISIGDIIRALEDGLILVDCLSEESPCKSQDNCETIFVWRRLYEGINKVLDDIKLSECLTNLQ